jgi:CBS domain-containing protein
MTPSGVAVFEDDTLRHVANVFAEHGVTRAPVVARQDPGDVRGVISLQDLLQARMHDVTEETHRERHITPGRKVLLADLRQEAFPTPSHLRTGGPG